MRTYLHDHASTAIAIAIDAPVTVTATGRRLAAGRAPLERPFNGSLNRPRARVLVATAVATAAAVLPDLTLG